MSNFNDVFWIVDILYILKAVITDHKCVCFAGQDGTLQSFSSVHERFNKNLGHGEFSRLVQ